MKKVVIGVIVVGAIIFVGIKTSYVLLQEEKAPKVSAISGPIDSWFKITVQDKHVGFSHQQIAPRIPASLGYEYSSESELYIQETALSEDIKAVFNKDLIPISFTYSMSGGNNKNISIALIESEGMRSLELTDQIAGKKYWEVSPKDEIYPASELALYSLKQRGVLKEGSTHKVKSCNILANTGDILKADSIKVIGKEKRKYLDKETEVTAVEIATMGMKYTVYIDNYGREVESNLPAINARRIIVANSAEAMGNLSPAVSQKGRRDPFKKALVLSGKESSTPLIGHSTPDDSADLSGDRALVIAQEQVEQYMAEVDKLAQDLEKASKSQIELKPTYDRFVKIYKGLMNVVKSPIYRDKLNKLRQRAEQLYPGGEYVYKEASQLYENIVDKFNQNSWKDIPSDYNKLKSLSTRSALLGTEYQALVDELLTKSTKLADRVSNREEIMRRNLQVSGIIYYIENKPTEVEAKVTMLGGDMSIKETVYLSVPNSYAIVNSKAVREGDLIEGVLVKKISKDRVVFSYKEEELPVYIKRQ